MERHKRTTVSKIDLTPELLAAVKRAPTNITGKTVRDDTGWVIEKSVLAINSTDKLGWIVRSPGNFDIKWTGEESPESLHVNNSNEQLHISCFGNGIICFELPWLFKIDYPDVGLSIRSIPNNFDKNMLVLDSLSPPQTEPHDIKIYWKIVSSNIVINVKCNDNLGFIQPYNIGLWKEANLIIEEYNASYT